MSQFTSARTSVVAAALVVLSCQANAAFVVDGNYVFTRAELRAGSGTGSGSDAIDVDPGAADTGEQELIKGPWYAAGRAWASSTAGPSLRARSTSSAPDAGFSSPSSSTFVRSAYRDVLIPDAAGAPAQISFNFTVHAELMVTSTVPGTVIGSPNSTHAIVSARAMPDVIGFQNALLGNGISAAVRSNNGAATTTTLTEAFGTWTSATFTELATNHYDFHGTFSYLADLLSFGPAVTGVPHGAYFLGIGLGAQTSTLGGAATVDATSTLNLVSITLPGGGALPAGVGFAFESGAPLTVVPLPAPAVLLLGALPLLRRRR